MSKTFELISSATQFAPKDSNAGSSDLIRAARSAETDGVDSLLVGYTATGADGWILASTILAATTKMRVLLAHRPGVMSPAVAARMAGTLDVVSGGRLSLNIVSGGSATDQMREGDFVEHDARYQRAIEYTTLLKRLWTEDPGLDHEGEYFHLVKSGHRLKPLQTPHPPIFMGGASDAGKAFAVASADTYMSWSEPVGHAAARFDEIRKLCEDAGRPAPGFSMSMRCIFGETEDAAWELAHSMLPSDVDLSSKQRPHREDVGRNRQLGLAEESMVHDERLWMGLTAASGGQGSTGALVGTPEQVESSLLKYVETAGTDKLLLTGPDGAYAEFPAGFVENLKAKANALLAQS